jgi:hypothetical protein
MGEDIHLVKLWERNVVLGSTCGMKVERQFPVLISIYLHLFQTGFIQSV